MIRAALPAAVIAATLSIAAPARADDTDDVAYRRLTARDDPHYFRAGIEQISFLLAGATWYWIDRERQVGDWDYPSIKQRLNLEAWRFDNNAFPINFIWHPIDGGYYHATARSNELSFLASLGFATATSFLWEYVLEFREKVSINDMIVTTGAGTITGEFLHWMGKYLESAPSPRAWHAVARWTLGFPSQLHDTLDRRKTLREGTAADSLGLSSDIWHRFRLSSGATRADLGGFAADDAGPDALTVAELYAGGELVAIPGYLRSPRLRRNFADGNLTAVGARISIGDDALGLDLVTDAILAGHHRQDLPEGGVGHATTIGLALGYRYRRELLGDWTERLAQMHLPAPGIDHHVIGPGFAVRARARVHWDFAGVHPAGYPAWRAGAGDINEKAILKKHQYYYGWGPSAHVDLEVALPRVSAGAVLDVARYASQEGLDRTQEELTADVQASDTSVSVEAWLRVALTDRLRAEARFSHEDRDGEIGGIETSQELRRIGVSIGVEL